MAASLDLDGLLERTSRTFALSIPLLPEPERLEVGIAYLLFRIADTFEDGALWPPERRLRALADFERILEAPADAERLAREWVAAPPIGHRGYVELLEATPHVLAALRALPEQARRTMVRHLTRTARGMAGYVARVGASGRLELEDLRDLRRYCYAVAGIVGEMLTDLFLLNRPALAPASSYLRRRAPLFGEGLQLVNVLKDSSFDQSEGRSYLHGVADRARVFAIARRDLERASQYVGCLQSHGARRGTVAFCALPVLLARASLDRLEQLGPGSKITRAEVHDLLARMNRALDRGDHPAPAALEGLVGILGTASPRRKPTSPRRKPGSR